MGDSNTRYADIIIDISHEALDRVFQYRVPLSLWKEVRPGSRVFVPFGRGNRETEGYVVAIRPEADYEESKIKEILRVNTEGVSVESELIKVASFLKEQYGSTMIQALRTVLPVKAKMKPKEEVFITLSADIEAAQKLLAEWEQKHYVARARFLFLLIEKGRITKEEAVKGCNFPLKEIRRLAEQGIVKLESRIKYRNPFPELTKRSTGWPLNEEQQAVADNFQKDYDNGKRGTYLLYGVTGSGKTEVYLALIEQVLAKKKQVIVLIPEISLTYQTVRRFYERFGERIAVINSRMSKGEKSDACERIRAGEADVIIGARSALFAPTERLGLIIIDEEHDGAYKSDTSPKYHARETAVYRAGLCGASVVLGSATPSVEAYARALSGEYKLWTLKKRAGKAMLPTTQIIDLREEFKKGNRSIFSGELHKKIEERLAKKEQIMLFCPICKSSHVAAFGLGTEKVEAALHAEFPTARVLRMDMDTTRRKHAHEEMLAAFSKGEADILLGTQMIVKGHDYANVTLVGILAADLSLHEQDFRSGEKTFQLLCQAAGRAGRGDKRGDVIIQTYSPEHYSITTAAEHSYENFFKEEYTYRQLMGYPPCAHMLVILVQSGDESQSVIARLRIEKMIEQSQVGQEVPVQILAPGQASLSKLKDVYRQVLYLKHKDKETLLDLKRRLEPVLEKHPMFAGITIQFDFDPLSHY